MSRIGWETHIGDANGKIALWLDESGARDLQDMLGAEDKLRDELETALKKAYPPDEQAAADPRALSDSAMGNPSAAQVGALLGS